MGQFKAFAISFPAIAVAILFPPILLAQAQSGVQNVARSVYWDKPLALPPSPDELMTKVPPSIAKWLKDWQERELAGKSATESQIEQLRALFQNEPVTAARMAQIVAAIAEVDGNVAVLPLYEEAFSRAELELKAFQASDVAAKTTVDAMWLLHSGLWNAQKYSLDQRLLELVRPWEVRGSGHSQWASYTYAELLFYQRKPTEAYEAFKNAVAERDIAFEPSEGINRALNWELATTSHDAGKFAESIPYLRAVAGSAQSSDAKVATRLLIHALVETGRAEEAEKIYVEYSNSFPLAFSEAIDMRAFIATAQVKQSKDQ